MSAVDRLITDNLGAWSSAVKTKSAAGRGTRKKLELYGIKKLRGLILELAVRGSLVPQDPNDEPAFVLLKKLAIEKSKLVKEGKVKKQKKLSEITEDEKYCVLPNSWEWSRLGVVTNYGITDKAEPGDVNRETWVLELEDVEKETSRLLQKIRYSEKQFQSSKNRFFKNDVIYGKLRPYLDKVIVADEDGVCTTEMMPVRGYFNISASYLRLVMKSPNFIMYADDSTHGMSLPRLGTDKARMALFPIAPYDEQQRIVAKADELMALCDQLEQQIEASNSAHQTLVQTLLGALTNTNERDGFDQAWTRIAVHFDTLFTTEWSIDQLKQTILQLAVMGKLVPQVPNDEPASVLLKKIATEKAKLIKDGKIKKQKLLSPITDDEKLFELPEGWEWVRFGNLVNFKAALVKPEEFQDFDQVAPDSIEKGTGKLLFRRTVAESGIRGPNSRFYQGQIIYSKIRPSLSKVIIAEFDGLCSADMYPLDALINSQYLLKIMLSEAFLIQVRAAENRIKMPKLNIESLSNILVPLAPEKLQNGIVNIVETQMTLCDALKTQINSSQTMQLKLADSLTEQAVG